MLTLICIYVQFFIYVHLFTHRNDRVFLLLVLQLSNLRIDKSRLNVRNDKKEEKEKKGEDKKV